jgi:hypothetical protein
VAILGEGGVVGNIGVQPQPAEPPIGEIEMDLLAQPAFRADAVAIADQQHPDQQLRIDGGPPRRTIERSQSPTQLAQVNEAIDGSEHMIGRHMAVERELVE